MCSSLLRDSSSEFSSLHHHTDDRPSNSLNSFFDFAIEPSFSHSNPNDSNDIWWSEFESKGIFLNASSCLQDLDADEGYVDYSSNCSSGVLSPDLEFAKFPFSTEHNMESETTHGNMKTPDFAFDECSNAALMCSKYGFSDRAQTMTDNTSAEVCFDDCGLLSLPPSPELTDCFDIFLQSPLSSLVDPLQSYSKPADFFDTNRSTCDREFEDHTLSDISVDNFENNYFDHMISPSSQSDYQSPSPSSDVNSSADKQISGKKFANISFFDDFQDCQHSSTTTHSQSCCTQQQHSSDNKIYLNGREDHGYAAKLPASSSYKMRKRLAHRHNDSTPRHSSSKSSTSLLELFLTSNKTLDPNKGSNAALVAEMKKLEKSTNMKSERLLKRLLTIDVDRRRNETRH